MREFIVSSIFIVLGMLYGFTVGAYNVERTNGFNQFLSDGLRWIGANSEYDTSGITKLPVVVLADRKTLNYIWISRKGKSDDPPPNAFYTRERHSDGMVIHKIYLINDWNPRDVRDGKTGIHELVHYVQFSTNQKKFKCSDESELDATNIAADWWAEKAPHHSGQIAVYRAQGERHSRCK